MKRLAQKALKKKHPTKKVVKTIPNLYLSTPGGRNVTDTPGETLIRRYQYPHSIQRAMREAQIEKFKGLLTRMKTPLSDSALIELLNRAPPLHAHESRGGCSRWVYESTFMDDGQDRYEPSDDISFDVLGTFCPSCELSRRLIELKPVHYEVPGENETLVASTTGFTNKMWEFAHDPLVNHCRMDGSVRGSLYVGLSPDLFRTLLAMVVCAGNYVEIGSILGAYRCGNRRVYVVERAVNNEESEMDFEQSVLKRLSGLEEPRFFSDASVRITLGEFNPYISNQGGDDVCYGPLLTLNATSAIIKNLSIRIQMEHFEHVFYCLGDTNEYRIKDLRDMDEVPQMDGAFPKVYIGTGGYSQFFVYSILYLNETPPGEFTRIIHEEPLQFYKVCGLWLAQESIQEYRDRLMMCKKIQSVVNFDSSIKAIRACLGGLLIKK